MTNKAKCVVMKKPLTKTGLIAALSDKMGVTKKDAECALTCLGEVIASELKTAGAVTLSGLVKFKLVEKPAVKAGIRMDPFTKTEKNYPAKPASRRVKVLALKNLVYEVR